MEINHLFFFQINFKTDLMISIIFKMGFIDQYIHNNNSMGLDIA